MDYWFILLGSNRDPEDKRLYQALAREYSIIMIGYGIDDDITHKTNQAAIQKKLEECYARRKFEADSEEIRAKSYLINLFINEIKEGDTIISPSLNGNYGKYRVGKAVGRCTPVRSFFEGREEELDDFLGNTPGSDAKPNQKSKPARQVKWEDKEKDLADFLPELKDRLSEYINAAVNKLSIHEEEEEETKIELVIEEKVMQMAYKGSNIEVTLKQGGKEKDNLDFNILISTPKNKEKSFMNQLGSKVLESLLSTLIVKSILGFFGLK